jgi:hypothetical protein
MTVHVKEWTQETWTRPGITYQRDKGDFSVITDMLPDPLTNHRLVRGPGWSGAESMPANFTSIQGGFFDNDAETRVLVGPGTDSGTKLRSFYYNTSWTQVGPYTIQAGVTSLGGLKALNLAWWAQKLYFIGSDSDVYRHDAYNSAASSFHVGSAKLLAPYGDRMYMVNNLGEVFRLNDADNAFESFYTPLVALDIRYMAAYRHFLVLIAAGMDGSITLYRLPDLNPQTLHTLAIIPGDGKLTGSTFGTSYGSTFFLHDDKIFFVLGRYLNASGEDYNYNIYAFNGTWIEHLGTVSGATYIGGFLRWKGRLLLHHFDTDKHYLQVFMGNRFTQFTELDVPNTPAAPALSLGSELFLLNNNGGTYTLYRAGSSDYEDCSMETSYLDMGHPGKEKRLERITALLDGAASDVTITLKYRTDDTASWTTAGTATDSKRASVGSLAVSFYTIQLRVEIAESSGDAEDIGLQTLSVIYTVDD